MKGKCFICKKKIFKKVLQIGLKNFCSRKCWYVYYKKLKNTYVIIQCMGCGKQIVKKFGSKFCYDCLIKNKKISNDKYRRKNRKRLLVKKKKWYKGGKEHICSFCKNKFKRPISFITKYCSRKCFELDMMIKRKGKNNPAYRNGLRVDPYGYTSLHSRVCKEYRRKFLEKNENLYCENCYSNVAIKYETHHIVFASEKPKHKKLHNVKNLILLCIECHNNFHKNKKLRNKLIIDRRLNELFGGNFLR
jgi:5-methylcytosine-specific restriction endonuclease McrA